jgi:hypothetical protein
MATRDPYATTAGRALLGGFEQTDEMLAADAAIAASTPETEPENWTYTNNYGWIYTGPLAQKNTATQRATYLNSHMGGPSHDARRQWKTGSWGWMQGGDMMEQNTGDVNSGIYGNFTQDSWDRFSEIGGRGNPLIDTNPHDIAAILEMYNQDYYNPYASEAYADGDKQVKKGSVADVLYGLTKDRNYDKRMEAYRAIRSLDGDMAQRTMTQSFWNQNGLRGVFGEYSDNVDNPLASNPLMQGQPSGDSSGGFMSSFNEARGNTGASDFTGINSGGRDGFLGAYQAKREEQAATRPSVRSLFKEMEDYENE